MNATQRGVITLLKSAVMGEGYLLPEGFELATEYPALKRHHMDTLLYEGAVRCGISRQSPVMQQLFQKYCKHLLVSEGQQRQVARIFAEFEENGIEYLPLKGCRMKNLYPKPELRYMGDADILIRLEQYGGIKPLMEELGFEEGPESDHELHWEHRELSVELHKHLIPSNNEGFYDYYGIGWQLAANREGYCWSMTPEDEWIFLFTHFAKHFRDGGIGCRYVVDLWVYLRHNPGMDDAYIRREMEKLQLLEFHDNIRRLIDVWFADLPGEKKLDVITDYIFASGSWGEQESKTISAAVRDSRTSGRASESKIRYALRIMFPGARTLRSKYTVLKKHPWLLPGVWVVRPFYKLLWERESLLRHRDNLHSITDEKVDAWRELLQYMGIDCQF